MPETLILAAVPAVKLVPEPNVRVFRFKVVVEPPMARALVLAVVRLLKVWVAAVPLIFWAPALLKVTVPVPCVNVPELAQFPPTERLPLVEINVLPLELLTPPITVISPEPLLNVPPEFVRSPVIVRVLGPSAAMDLMNLLYHNHKI